MCVDQICLESLRHGIRTAVWDSDEPVARIDFDTCLVEDGTYAVWARMSKGFLNKNLDIQIKSISLEAAEDQLIKNVYPMCSYLPPRINHSMTSIRNSIVIFGGRLSQDELLEYEVNSELLPPTLYMTSLSKNDHSGAGLTWKAIAVKHNTPSPRFKHSATATEDGLLIVFGGNVGDETLVNDMWIIKLNENSLHHPQLDLLIWYPIRKSSIWPPPLEGAQMSVIGSTLYLFGGISNDRIEGSDLFAIDINTFHPTNSPNCFLVEQKDRVVPLGRTGHSMVAVYVPEDPGKSDSNPEPNALFLFGGKSTIGALNDFWTFHPLSNKWIQHDLEDEATNSAFNSLAYQDSQSYGSFVLIAGAWDGLITGTSPDDSPIQISAIYGDGSKGHSVSTIPLSKNGPLPRAKFAYNAESAALVFVGGITSRPRHESRNHPFLWQIPLRVAKELPYGKLLTDSHMDDDVLLVPLEYRFDQKKFNDVGLRSSFVFFLSPDENGLPCPFGSILDEETNLCRTCDLGMVGISTSDGPMCQDCPPGYFIDELGLQGTRSCILCPEGTYRSEGLTCQQCNNGEFCPIGTASVIDALQDPEIASSIHIHNNPDFASFHGAFKFRWQATSLSVSVLFIAAAIYVLAVSWYRSRHSTRAFLRKMDIGPITGMRDQTTAGGVGTLTWGCAAFITVTLAMLRLIFFNHSLVTMAIPSSGVYPKGDFDCYIAIELLVLLLLILITSILLFVSINLINLTSRY
eukprot:GHVP01030690.1.p1 GENE.GHVP01030690.1~~GHVP01030690.1.p1  ORF type:complete len:827 (+),score=134.45 GHVP01030690.1:255-2483(+)